MTQLWERAQELQVEATQVKLHRTSGHMLTVGGDGGDRDDAYRCTVRYFPPCNWQIKDAFWSGKSTQGRSRAGSWHGKNPKGQIERIGGPHFSPPPSLLSSYRVGNRVVHSQGWTQSFEVLPTFQDQRSPWDGLKLMRWSQKQSS